MSNRSQIQKAQVNRVWHEATRLAGHEPNDNCNCAYCHEVREALIFYSTAQLKRLADKWSRQDV